MQVSRAFCMAWERPALRMIALNKAPESCQSKIDCNRGVGAAYAFVDFLFKKFEQTQGIRFENGLILSGHASMQFHCLSEQFCCDSCSADFFQNLQCGFSIFDKWRSIIAGIPAYRHISPTDDALPARRRNNGRKGPQASLLGS